MPATNKMNQPANYSERGSGKSAELQIRWGLVIVTAIIPIIAYVLPN